MKREHIEQHTRALRRQAQTADRLRREAAQGEYDEHGVSWHQGEANALLRAARDLESLQRYHQAGDDERERRAGEAETLRDELRAESQRLFEARAEADGARQALGECEEERDALREAVREIRWILERDAAPIPRLQSCEVRDKIDAALATLDDETEGAL